MSGTGLAQTNAVQTRAVVEQEAQDNLVEQTDQFNSVSSSGVGLGNSGLLGLNQESGNLNSQANVIVAAVAADPDVVMDELTIRQALQRNQLSVSGGANNASLRDSFTGAAGVVQVNQAAGILNQQVNALVVSLGGSAETLLSLADVELAQVSADNTVAMEVPQELTNEFSGNFENFSGIGQVSQVSGSMNQVVNTVVFSYSAVGP